jgi:hypothetical protein
VIELALEEGWVEAELAEDFPELKLIYAAITARPRHSPSEVRERLRTLADRYTGGKVIHMRQDAVPWAYRVSRARSESIPTPTGRPLRRSPSNACAKEG